ncbi:MAG TPA: cyclic nucleotide-binding domain-containing protein, partial [Bacteroidales bacterium]|nr:cyclic nucleotide-binding domain-containing protein [Bacteroidales bacterium]
MSDAGSCKGSTVYCARCGVKSALLCTLTDEELRRVDAGKLQVTFRQGETIRKQGTFLSHVLILRSGLAKVYLEGPGDRNTILRIVRPTHFIGGPGLHYERIHHYSVSALTRTEVCFIDASLFLELLKSNASFAAEYMKDYSMNTLAVYDRLVNITQKQMPGR